MIRYDITTEPTSEDMAVFINGVYVPGIVLLNQNTDPDSSSLEFTLDGDAVKIEQTVVADEDLVDRELEDPCAACPDREEYQPTIEELGEPMVVRPLNFDAFSAAARGDTDTNLLMTYLNGRTKTVETDSFFDREAFLADFARRATPTAA